MTVNGQMDRNMEEDRSNQIRETSWEHGKKGS